MRLLFLSTTFPLPWAPDKGPFNLELCRGLLPEHEVRAVVPVPWTEELRAQLKRSAHIPPGRETAIAGVPVSYPRYYYTPLMLRRSYGDFLWHSIRSTLQKSAAPFRPEVVLAYWAHPDGEVAVRFARNVGARVWIMVGGSDVLLLARRGARRRVILRALRGADGVLPVSVSLRDRLAEMGLAPERLFLFARGVDRDRFRPGSRAEARSRLDLPPDPPILLWVGRMVPVKGLDVLVRACVRLRAAVPGLHVLLAGSGPLQGRLEAQVASAGLRDVVRFLGSVRHAELAEWFRACDAVVLPSHSEGVPNVLLEAHACGVPFVASAVGGVGEVARAGVDRLVPPDDAHALADGIIEVLARSRPDALALAATVPSLTDTSRRLIEILSRDTRSQLHPQEPGARSGSATTRSST